MTHLIFGGSASGKSSFAEDLALQYPQPRIYVATMQPWDEECVKRIEKHRKQRENKGFSTVECYSPLFDVYVGPDDTVLLECMGNLVSNVLFAPVPPENPAKIICDQLDKLASTCKNLLVVSNDIFLEEVPNSPEMEQYFRVLSEINRHMTKTFDSVTEVVCGIPISLKEGISC